jgi:hypothetical protein
MPGTPLMSSCGTPCPVGDVLSGDLRARPAYWRISGSWFPDSCSPVKTRARIARRDGINKPYGQAGPVSGKTRRSQTWAAQPQAVNNGKLLQALPGPRSACSVQ